MAVALHFSRLESLTDSTAPPLVIAHGLLGQGRNFGTLARGFAEKRGVISVDMRNHGDSPWDDRMDYDAMADDLAAVIEDHAGGHASVLGHSMGGKAAMVLALKRPELLASLVVADMAPVDYDHDYHKELEAMRTVGLAAVTRRAHADEILRPKIPVASMRAFLLQNLSVDPEGAHWKPNLAALAANMSRITGWDTPLPGVLYDGPTLFVKGADSTHVLSSHEPMISSLFPHVVYDSIAGAAHWLHAERPKAFLESVDRFLSEHDI